MPIPLSLTTGRTESQCCRNGTEKCGVRPKSRNNIQKTEQFVKSRNTRAIGHRPGLDDSS
jgi:hypothetical protein